MEIREILLNRSSVSRYSDQRVDPQRLQHLLQVAGNTTGPAQQQATRFLIIEDVATRHVLKQACEQQRHGPLSESLGGHQTDLDGHNEQHDLEAMRGAPCVICILGELDKPAWRELSWRAVERLRLAALSEGLQAEPVNLDSFDFLHPLLDLPQTHSAVALVSLGKAQQIVEPTAEPLDVETLCLPYRPDRDALRFGDEPRLSDKQLPIDLIRTAAEIQACRNIDSVFECVMNELACFLHFDRSSVAFLDPQDNTVRLRKVRNPKEPLVGENALIPLDERNVIGWVMLNRSGLLRNDIAAEMVFDEQMRTEELRSDMIVPMAVGADVYGTLNVGSRRPNAFEAVEFEILREFGRLAGAAVHRLLKTPDKDEGAPHTPSLSP